MPKMSTLEVRKAAKDIAAKHDVYLGRVWTDEPTVLRGKGTPNRVVGWQVTSYDAAVLLASKLNKAAAMKGCEVNARVTGGGNMSGYDYVRCDANIV